MLYLNYIKYEHKNDSTFYLMLIAVSKIRYFSIAKEQNKPVPNKFNKNSLPLL